MITYSSEWDMLSNFVLHSISRFSMFIFCRRLTAITYGWINPPYDVLAMHEYDFFENRNWCSIAHEVKLTVVFVAWNTVGSSGCWLKLIIHYYFVFVSVRRSNRSNESKWRSSQKCSHSVQFHLIWERNIQFILWFWWLPILIILFNANQQKDT